MNVAIMQPYFFPYIGYFQLMKSVDVFVCYDDVQFMKGGWINRNRILRDGNPAYWTFPVHHDDFRIEINRRRYDASPKNIRSLIGKLEGAYRHAPNYKKTIEFIASGFSDMDPAVSRFNQASLREVGRRLGIDCRLVASSEIEHDRSLKGQDRVLAICEVLGAKRYVNAIGGVGLYDAEAFSRRGMELRFIRPRATTYRQWGEGFVPFLSIVDVLMFNSEADASAMLSDVELVPSRNE